MTTAAPYLDLDRLAEAARLGTCVPCHQCAHSVPNRDCPSCLGSGWIRPCGVCFRHRRSHDHICAVCAGLLFTAGDCPRAEDVGAVIYGRTGLLEVAS